MEYRGKHYTIIQGSIGWDAIFSCCSRSLSVPESPSVWDLGSLIRKSLRKIDVNCCTMSSTAALASLRWYSGKQLMHGGEMSSFIVCSETKGDEVCPTDLMPPNRNSTTQASV